MRFLLLLALFGSAPASAVQAGEPEATRSVDIEADRLAAAKRLVGITSPPGQYARTVTEGMQPIMNRLLKQSVQPDPEASKVDPHHRERMDILARVVLDEVTKLSLEAEPEMINGMARAYARRFTAAELDELARFFSTPTGRRYTAESLDLMKDPEFVAVLTGLQPRFQRAMPSIMERVEKATAHLPWPGRTAAKE